MYRVALLTCALALPAIPAAASGDCRFTRDPLQCVDREREHRREMRETRREREALRREIEELRREQRDREFQRRLNSIYVPD